MANSVTFNKEVLKVGSTLTIGYKIKEGEKERVQLFKGILIKIHGQGGSDLMITVRKLSKSAIGIERIFPLYSPNIASIKIDKTSDYQKAKLYFIRNLNESQIRHKLYRQK